MLIDASHVIAVPPLPANATTSGRLLTALYPARPNPFTGETAVQFDVPSHAGPVVLAVYNVRGQLVRTLVDRPLDRGRHETCWDGVDARGFRTPSGVYFLRLHVGRETKSQKLLLMR